MKLFLHIGTEKTGSTSIQKYLHTQATALAQSGIHYCRSFGRPNNTIMAVVGMDLDPAEPFFLKLGIVDEYGHAAFRVEKMREFADEVAGAHAAGCHTFVISTEHCQSRLKTDGEVARIKSMLTPLFDEIRILCYLRPQVDLAVSSASTLAREARVTADYFDRIQASEPYFHYLDLLERWAGQFGVENIVPIAFRRVENVVADFARRIGVPGWADAVSTRSNGALDVHTIALLNAMQAGRHILAGKITRHPVPFGEVMPVHETIRLPLATARRIHAAFEASNSALAERWTTITPSDLEPDWSQYGETGNLEKLLLPEPLPLYLKALVDHYCVNNWLAEALMNLAYSQRAEARGNLANAGRFLALAQSLTELVRQSFGETAKLLKAEKEIEKHAAVLARKDAN